METRLYTVFDQVAEESGPVFNAVNDGVALRQFKRLIADISPVDKSEYRLYFLGTFDFSTMRLTVEVHPLLVEAFFSKYSGVPGVDIGSGPSLNNIEEELN